MDGFRSPIRQVCILSQSLSSRFRQHPDTREQCRSETLHTPSHQIPVNSIKSTTRGGTAVLSLSVICNSLNPFQALNTHKTRFCTSIILPQAFSTCSVCGTCCRLVLPRSGPLETRVLVSMA